eukprot:GFUD01039518.1.p1 GENE.GFUD01039518.1~~GFUD01039518.1.p1  ORF type:complete len:308 (-),score=65.60 GFUD01039518.1:498-1421(-)
MSRSPGLKMRNVVSFLAVFLTLNALAEGKLNKIEEDNWQDLLTGEWMVEFFAPWCPACRGLQPTWEDFAGWSEDLDIGIGQVDVTTSPGLSGRFMVTALPTIFHVKDGVFRQYRGARDKDSFISFVEDKKWTGVEPISSWKSPDSLQMSLVSYFFKLSMVLRNVHTTLTEDYQMPYWVSYVAFAVATILLGGILGLILVCCIDCVYPPRRDDELHHHVQQATRADKKDSDAEEEDDVEELEGSQDEGEEDQDTQDENLSQDEGENSQDEGNSQDEASQNSQEEGSQDESENYRSENKSRRRRARKAD